MKKLSSVFIAVSLLLIIAITLASCGKHEHSYSEEVTAPTCTEGGYTTYTCECGESYVDNETGATGHDYVDGICSSCGVAEEDNSEDNNDDSNGDDNTGGDNTDDDNTGDGSGDDENDSGSSSHTHSYTAEVTAPTCEAGGYTTYTCECGESYVDDETDATGHNYVDGICSSCGIAEEDNSEDNNDDSNGDDNTGGDNTDDDNTGDGSGDDENDSGSSSHTHSYTAEVTAPTCTQDGYTIYTCSCGDSYVDDETDANGHDCGEDNICKNCGKRLTPSEGLKYTLSDDETYYIVSGIGTCTDTDIIIPDTYNNLPVKEIGSSAFYNCYALTSIEIPASVTSIGSYAFSSCSKLTFNEYDNEYYLGNEENPYYALIKVKNTSITSFVINENTKVIADNAFEDCRKLMSIEIPVSVTNIGASSFEYFYNLVEVINKSSLDITKGSSKIACHALEVHNGESKIVNIDDYIFYTCDGVNYLVTYIGKDTKLILPEDYNGENYEINKHAFYNRYDITSIEIPEAITSIGDYAFDDCDALTSIEIPASVTSIGSWAFSGCDALTCVGFGDNSQLQTIDHNAFRNCAALTSIEIPASVTSIGVRAFYGCDALTNVSFGDNSQLQTIAANTFEDCDALTSIEIPASVTSIGSYAFEDCSALTSVSFGDNSQLQTIDNNAFSSCSALTSVSFGNNSQLQTIDNNAFSHCSALTSIEIPANVTNIADYAFYGCNALESVTFADTSNWYATTHYNHAGNPDAGTLIDVTDSSTNARNLESTYYSYYWYKK